MGVSGISYLSYMKGTSVGVLPLLISYVFIGVNIALVDEASSSTCDSNNTIKYILLAVGIVVTIAVSIIITLYSRREMQRIQSMIATNKKSSIVPIQGDDDDTSRHDKTLNEEERRLLADDDLVGISHGETRGDHALHRYNSLDANEEEV